MNVVADSQDPSGAGRRVLKPQQRGDTQTRACSASSIVVNTRSVICLKHNLQSEMMIIAGINFCLIFYILSSNLGSWRHDDDDDDDEVGF